MHYMEPLPGFEPGTSTKGLLLFVKKIEQSLIGGTALPGLIQDKLFDMVMSFFIIAFMLECVGLWFIIDAYGLGFWKGVMSVAFLVLLDIFFAYLYHLRIRTICLAKNRNLVLGLETANRAIIAAKQANNQNKIFWARFWSFFAAILIWSLAALKTVFFLSFQSLGGGGMDTKTLFILVTYIIVALIHMYFTGYAVFGLVARFRWWLDERRFVQGNQPQANEYKEVIITNLPMPEKATAGNGRHILERLLSADFIFRDEQKKSRVVLGQSLQNELAAVIQAEINREYMNEKGVEESALAPYQDEINKKVQQKIDEMIKVNINPKTNQSILHPELKTFLKNSYTLSDEQIYVVEQGQALCLLKSKGLLLDDELVDLANATYNPNASDEIAKHGVHLQLRQMLA